jgi:hypothetical protein
MFGHVICLLSTKVCKKELKGTAINFKGELKVSGATPKP